MPGRRLGCISGAGIIAVLVTLLLIAAFVVVRGGSLFIPGPLNAQASGEALGGVRSHAETGGRCAACHTAPWAADTLADRCLACHIPIAAELDDPLSLHGALNVRQAAGWLPALSHRASRRDGQPHRDRPRDLPARRDRLCCSPDTVRWPQASLRLR